MATDPRHQGAGEGGAEALLRLQWRPYRFTLPREMVTSQGSWSERQGWLLRLEAAEGRLGWGEAVLAPGEECRSPAATRDGISTPRAGARPGADSPGGLPPEIGRHALERRLPALPRPLACALGMALAELDGLGSQERGGWLAAPDAAMLLPAGEGAITALERVLAERPAMEGRPGGHGRRNPQPGTAPLHRSGNAPRQSRPSRLTVKWKVASDDDTREREVLEALLQRLPPGSRLRLDANGGWDRATARRWAERLAREPRLDWLEQPLPADDEAGLRELAAMVPVALDESVRADPHGIACGWPGWLVRRPLLEGDPRPLLAALQTGTPRLMLSTALETGIGRRFLQHLAGLQALGPTPTAPGLAPGWRPPGNLFSQEPEAAWEAAG